MRISECQAPVGRAIESARQIHHDEVIQHIWEFLALRCQEDQLARVHQYITALTEHVPRGGRFGDDIFVGPLPGVPLRVYGHAHLHEGIVAAVRGQCHPRRLLKPVLQRALCQVVYQYDVRGLAPCLMRKVEFHKYDQLVRYAPWTITEEPVNRLALPDIENHDSLWVVRCAEQNQFIPGDERFTDSFHRNPSGEFDPLPAGLADYDCAQLALSVLGVWFEVKSLDFPCGGRRRGKLDVCTPEKKRY